MVEDCCIGKASHLLLTIKTRSLLIHAILDVLNISDIQDILDVLDVLDISDIQYVLDVTA